MQVPLFIQNEATGKDPSFSEFYFCTHRKEKDKSWVNEKVETAYNKFEAKKEELLASQSASVDGDTNSASQPPQLSDMDIWVLSVGGKKKGRVPGLSSLGRSVKVPKQSKSAIPNEVDEIRSQVHAINSDLYKRLEEAQHQNQEMRRQNKKMKKELADTNGKLAALIEHVDFPISSNAKTSTSEDSETANDDSDSNSLNDDEY